jgi:hypothetical protein
MPFLDAASVVVAPEPKPYQEDPAALTFYRDLVEPFGVQLDEEVLRSGTQITHRDLLDHLLQEDICQSGADLIVLAHALPDVLPFAVNASHVNLMFGNRAESFGVSEQGLAAPFTALRIVSAYERAGRAERAVITVLETTTLPAPDPLVQDGKLVDSGVLLVFGGAGGLRVDAVETHASAETLSRRLRELDGKGTLVVTGPDGPGAVLDAKVHESAPGSYCTTVWIELARHWRTWQHEHETIVLSDVDARTGLGHLAVLRASDS